jgi:Eukaryotic aspartyl protease
MTFGCVSAETHLFYSQNADGILGLTKGGGGNTILMKPIFEQMLEVKIIDKEMFSLCLGKNGGYF